MDAKIDILRVKDTNGSEYAVYPKTLIKCVTNENGDNLEDTMKQFVADSIDDSIADTYAKITDVNTGNADTLAEAKEYTDDAYANSNLYTDQKIADLINGAPTTLDTLKEISDAMAENKEVVDALDEAIGKKADQTELDTHTGNNTIHITADERTAWNNKANSADLENYLPLSGGIINGDISVGIAHTRHIEGTQGNTDTPALYLNYNNEAPVYIGKGNTILHTGNAKDLLFPNNTLLQIGDDVAIGDQNVAGTLVVQGVNGDGSIEFKNQSGATLGKAIHTGNVGEYALPKSGGTISNGTEYPLGINNPNGWKSLLKYNNTTGEGYIGFQGSTPIVGSADALYEVVHGGNIDRYAIRPRGATPAVSLDSVNENGSYYVSYTSTDKPADYGEMLVMHNEDTVGQLYISHANHDLGMAFRGASHSGGFYPWRTVVDSGNVGNYALPLDGTAKNALGVRSHAHDSVNCTGMTIPQLKSTIEAWANSDAVNVSDFNVYTTRVGANFVNLWNNGDTTSTCGWGGWWYWYKLGADRTSDFVKFLVCGYQGADIYYVEIRQGVWSNLRPLLHTENISSYIGVASISEIPAGSYVGNGSARTINTDGNGKSCIITGNNGSVTVDEYGGVGHDSNGNVVGISMDTMKFVDGVLTMSADCAYNVTGVVYSYKVL